MEENPLFRIENRACTDTPYSDTERTGLKGSGQGGCLEAPVTGNKFSLMYQHILVVKQQDGRAFNPAQQQQIDHEPGTSEESDHVMQPSSNQSTCNGQPRSDGFISSLPVPESSASAPVPLSPNDSQQSLSLSQLQFCSSQSYPPSFFPLQRHDLLPGNSDYQAPVPPVPQLISDLKANTVDGWEGDHPLLQFLRSVDWDEDRLEVQSGFLRILVDVMNQMLVQLTRWAGISTFLPVLKEGDKTKLLLHSWSRLITLDLANWLARQSRSDDTDNAADDENLKSSYLLGIRRLDDLGLSAIKGDLVALVYSLRALNIDRNQFICLKYLVFYDTDVCGLENPEIVEDCQEQVISALVEYCLDVYPYVKERLEHVLLRIPEVQRASACAEEWLYFKYSAGDIADQSLLMEMIYAKHGTTATRDHDMNHIN